MAVCFFNDDYKNRYSCEYTIKQNGIEVIVDYEMQMGLNHLELILNFLKEIS